MINFKYLFFLMSIVFFSCSNSKNNTTKWKKEILEAEQSFAAMALREGIATAFLAYSSEDAVLSRNNTIIDGQENILKWFEERPQATGSSLVWKPDYVDVSKSGDLGYTYGTYNYTSLDSLGNEQSSSGVFHTVWKRQEDNSWKFVWD